MSDKNDVKIPGLEQVEPSPATSTTVETKPVSEPTPSPVENKDKQTAAFIKMRQEKRELKRQLEEAKSISVPTPAPVVEEQVKPAVVEPVKVNVPAHTNAVDIEKDSVRAIEALAMEKDVQAVPGAIMDIIEMVDNDPRLSRLHNIDPTLAFREAKSLWAAKAGIGPTPTISKSAPTSGGVGSKEMDLNALVTECEKHQPGTKEFNTLAKKIQEQLEKMQKF